MYLSVMQLYKSVLFYLTYKLFNHMEDVKQIIKTNPLQIMPLC